MATRETTVAATTKSRTPYQLDVQQTLQACEVLLKNVKDEKEKWKGSNNDKADLLNDDNDRSLDIPIWLSITTKKHITDKARLKPSKIKISHPISNASDTICILTASPQRAYKDVIASPLFPAELRSRITRVLGVDKLRKKFRQYEELRKLYAEHDLFLADDRILPYLSTTLGKTFYHSGAKRPIPINIAGQPDRIDGKRVKLTPEQKRDKDLGGKGGATPQAMAKEIDKALASALVHLAPGSSTSVKVARSSFTANMVSENIQAVVQGLVDKFIPSGFRGVRSIHIKSANSMAFPIWLASELWAEEGDVLDEKKVSGKKNGKTSEKPHDRIQDDMSMKQKRKAGGTGKLEHAKHAKKKRKLERYDKLAAEMAQRREVLQNEKSRVMAEALAGRAL